MAAKTQSECDDIMRFHCCLGVRFSDRATGILPGINSKSGKSVHVDIDKAEIEEEHKSGLFRTRR